MKTEAVWSERIRERDTFKNVVYSIAFRPDGTQLLLAVGARILVYDAQDGELLHSLKGHKGLVYAVAYSSNGERIASGGADNHVFIWDTEQYKGILKYGHTDSIQCLSYNPVTQQLASATATDLGLWFPEQRTVQKFKLRAKALCSAWTHNGQYIAIGLFNGQISIRDNTGGEKVLIERTAPVWCLAWSPPTTTQGKGGTAKRELLTVGCWDQTLSFYQLSGVQYGSDKKLDYDPCSLCYYDNGEYILMGGSDRKVSMYSKSGVFLKTVCEQDDWVWAVAQRPQQKFVAVGSNDGKISVYQTVFSTVHGLYQDRYAHRDTMTDVLVQHLVTDQKVRIKTRDYVKKIAVYRGRLAIQLPDRILVYETSLDDPLDMHYNIKKKILQKMDCNLLVVTTDHIILCQERKLQLYNFDGVKVREWVLDAVIRYIRVVGGPPGREGLLVGLKNGAVYKIYVDNRFPIPLVQHHDPIRCLDLSATRKKLAVVDERSKVYVYDLLTRQPLFEDSNANSVAWNVEMEDMFCFSGNGQLSIKTGNFPVHTQPLQGFVVGFKGSKIFCLHYLAMQTIDVPQSASMHRFLNEHDFIRAYQVACLGVTDEDWRSLAMSALESLELSFARKAFIRLRDARYIELINRIELALRHPNADKDRFLAEIMAYKGDFKEAARLYVKAGYPKQAIEMYLDLRQWDQAKAIAEQAGDSHELSVDGGDIIGGGNSNLAKAPDSAYMSDLLLRQAEWLLANGEKKAAAEMFWSSRHYTKAIRIMGDEGYLDELMTRLRTLNKVQRTELTMAAEVFVKHKHHEYAKETYLKLEDYKALMELHVKLAKWDEAFGLIKHRPELAPVIYEPYAEWLAINDRFVEAQEAFVLAGKPGRALLMLSQLTENAIQENRFTDAAFYFWKLAWETLKGEVQVPKELAADEHPVKAQFGRLYAKAELYYAFHAIYRYFHDPFTSLTSEVIFNTAQYVLNTLYGRLNSSQSNDEQKEHALVPDQFAARVEPLEAIPRGLSKVYCLFALAKQGVSLGAFKMGRTAYDLLLKLRVPNAWVEQIDFACLTLRSMPFVDKDELLSECYRCGAKGSLSPDKCLGDKCQNCGHSYQRNFYTFEMLPLVEFFIDDSVTDEEAAAFIQQQPPQKGSSSRARGTDTGDVQTLQMDDDDDDDEDEDDSFMQQLLGDDPESVVTGRPFPPIVLDRRGLMELPPDEVFIRRWDTLTRPSEEKKGSMDAPLPVPAASSSAAPATQVRWQYFRNIVPDVTICMCPFCMHFFHEEDFEFQVLKDGHCPFCRSIQPDF